MEFLNHLQRCANFIHGSSSKFAAPAKCPAKKDPWSHLSKTANGKRKMEERAPLIRAPTTLNYHGHLNPITKSHVDSGIAPNPHLVEEYGRMYDYALLREAKDQKKAFQIERFMELHRRATEYWLKQGGRKRERWDTVFISPRDEMENLMLLVEWERKWGIMKVNGCTVRHPSEGGERADVPR